MLRRLEIREVTNVSGGGEVLDLRPRGKILVEHRGSCRGDKTARGLLPDQSIADGVGEGATLEDSVVSDKLSANIQQVVCECCKRLDSVTVGETKKEMNLHVLAHTATLNDEEDIVLV